MAYNKEKWWHEDKQGRKIGWLWPEDFSAILESFYGERVWAKRFGEDFGYHRATIDRYRNGRTPLPKNVAMEVQMLGTLKVREIALSPVDADWLPAVQGSSGKLGAPDPADAGKE